MKHEMRLHSGPFELIKSGTKTIELRLYDEKRKLIKENDIIEFTNRTNNEKLIAKVIKLHKYNSFEELYKHFDKISLGYLQNEEANPNDMSIYYSKEEQEKYGVVGIEIKVLNDSDIYITKELESDRLILRKVNKEDYKQAYNNWCSDNEVTKYVMWNVHKNEEETKELFNIWEEEYSKPYVFRWGVELKSTNELIGVIDVVKFKKEDSRAEIGYCYGSKFWGNGYATEALKAVIDYLLNELNIELVVAGYEVSNPASGKVMEKAGMKCVGYLPKWIKNKEGKREDLKYCIIEK